jgi:adenylate cyclase
VVGQLHIIATSSEGTRAALREARQLTRRLKVARTVLLVPCTPAQVIAATDERVDAVLIGRVVQRGDALFIRTELVEVQNGWQLWGAQYNRSLSDIFAVEEEISREISETLRPRLMRRVLPAVCSRC